MEKQRSREEKLSLIVASILYAVGVYAVKSCEDIMKDDEIYPAIKNILKDDFVNTLGRHAFTFYLFNAVNGIDKKLQEVGFDKKEFDKELMVQLQRTLKISSLHDFEEIEDYEGTVIKFMGHKLCRELNIESAIFEFKINTIFNGYLIHGFYQSINHAWHANNIIEKKGEYLNKEAAEEKICPRCKKSNPPNTFRCRNEDCSDILPHND